MALVGAVTADEPPWGPWEDSFVTTKGVILLPVPPQIAQPLAPNLPMPNTQAALRELLTVVTLGVPALDLNSSGILSKVHDVLDAAQADAQMAHHEGAQCSMQLQMELQAQLNLANEELALANKKLYEANERCVEMKKANSTLLWLTRSRNDPVLATRVPSILRTVLKTLEKVDSTVLEALEDIDSPVGAHGPAPSKSSHGLGPVSFSFDGAMVTCDTEPEGSPVGESDVPASPASSSASKHSTFSRHEVDQDTDDIADILARQVRQKRGAREKIARRWHQVFEERDRGALEKTLAVFIFDQLADSELFPRSGDDAATKL